VAVEFGKDEEGGKGDGGSIRGRSDTSIRIFETGKRILVE